MAKAVDEDGEGDVARDDIAAGLRLGAERNRGGEALRPDEGGEDSVERGSAWGRTRVKLARKGR